MYIWLLLIVGLFFPVRDLLKRWSVYRKARRDLHNYRIYLRGYKFAQQFEPGKPGRLDSLMNLVDTARGFDHYTEFDHGIEDYVRTARKIRAIEDVG